MEPNSKKSKLNIEQEPWRDQLGQLSVLTDLAKDMGKWTILEQPKLSEFESLVKSIDERNKPFLQTLQDQIRSLKSPSTISFDVNTLANRINTEYKPFISSVENELTRLPNLTLKNETLNQFGSLVSNIEARSTTLLPKLEDQINKAKEYNLSLTTSISEQLKNIQPFKLEKSILGELSSVTNKLQEQSNVFAITTGKTLDNLKPLMIGQSTLSSITDSFKLLEDQGKVFASSFNDQLDKLKPLAIESSFKNVSTLFNDYNNKQLLFTSVLKDQITNFQLPLEKTITSQFNSVLTRLSEQTKPFVSVLESSLQHAQGLNMFAKWDSQAAFLPNNLLDGQVKNLQDSLGAVSIQLADYGINKKKWDLLQDFEEIRDEAISISDRVLEQQALTQIDINEIKQFVQRIEIKLDQKDKDFFSITLKWIAIVSFILTIMAEARDWIPKQEAVSKTQLEEFKRDLQQTIENKFKDTKDTRVVGRSCNLRLNPGLRTYVIKALEPGTEVIVIQTKGKWVYVSLTDETTNNPIHGWVFKKYLVKR